MTYVLIYDSGGTICTIRPMFSCVSPRVMWCYRGSGSYTGHMMPLGCIGSDIGHMVLLGAKHYDIGHVVPLGSIHQTIGHMVPLGILHKNTKNIIYP